MTRLMETMARGATPDRMVRQVEAVVTTLRDQGDPEQVQEWLEEMRDGFAESAEAAVEAIDEVESTEKAARRHAENAARAMAAVRDAFSQYLVAPAAA
jgi:lipoate-protein ligase A